MSSFDKAYAALMAESSKQASVSQATAQKKVALGDGNLSTQDAYTAGLATTGDTGQSLTGTASDVRTMSPLQILNAYGPDRGAAILSQAARGASQVQRDQELRQTPVEGVTDTLGSVGLGAFNGVAGIGALAEGILSPTGGTMIAEKVGQFNDWARENQSEALQGNLKVSGGLANLDQQDNAVEAANEAAATGSNLLPTLKRIGKDALDAGVRGAEDPASLRDGVAQGVGSLLAGGAVAKGVGLAGRGVGALASRAGLADEAVAAFTGAVDRHAMTGTIGALEAGGAYQQTAAQVMKMSHGDLTLNSADYRDLLGQGMTPDEAQREVANRSGLKAAAIQAPIALATGKLVSKFEGAPFASGGFRESLANMGKEAIEEGIQSGAGQFAQNVGIKTTADQTQDLGDGVGGQIGQGALYGSLTAGVVQGPAGIGMGTYNAGRWATGKAVDGAKGALDWVLNRGDKVIDEVNRTSPVSSEAMAQASSEAVAEAPSVSEAIDQDLFESNVSPEDTALAQGYVDKVIAQVGFSDADLANESPLMQATLSGSANRFEAIQRAADIAKDTAQVPQDRIAAGFFLLDQVRNNSELMYTDLPDALAKLPADHPAMAALKRYDSIIADMATHPEVKQAIQAAMQIESQIKAENLTEEAIATPEGQTDVSNAVKMAEHMPDQMDPEVAKTILAHASSGLLERNGIVLTPAQKASVEAAIELNDLKTKREATAERLQMRSTVDAVSDQIQSDLSNHNFTYRSATQHTVGVLTALSQGNLNLAQGRMKEFHDFAQTMANKVHAGNEAALSGKSSKTNQTGYQAVDPTSGEWFEGKLWVDPKHWGSVNRAQQASLDADAVVTMANNMVRKFPELGMSWIMPVALDTSLNKPVSEVARAARMAGRAAPVKEQTPQNKQQTVEAAPVREPATAKQVIEDVSSSPAKGPVSEVRTQVLDAIPAPVQAVEAKADLEPKAQVKAESVEQPVVDSTESLVEPTAETKKVSISDTFPNLVGGEKNRLTRGFKVPTEATSRLTNESAPGRAVVRALASNEALAAFAGEQTNKLTENAIQGYKRLLKLSKPAYEEVVSRLAEALGKSKPNQDSLEQLLDKNEEVYGFTRGKALNIVEPKAGDALGYNETLIQSAVLAGLHWAVTSASTVRLYDESDVARFLSKDPLLVSQDELDFFNTGVPVPDAKRALAQKIVEFWGLAKEVNAPLGYTEGVPEAVAAEILYGLQNAGVLELQSAKIDTGDGSVKTFNRVVLSDTEGFKQIKEDIRSFPDAIQKAVVVGSESVNHIGQAPKVVAKTQLRNRLVNNTKQQLAVIEREQNQAHFWNQTVADFYEALGEDGLVDLLGGGQLNDNQNKKHQATLEGKNRTLLGAFDQLRALRAETEAKAAVDGKAFTDMPIHYEYNFTRVNRLQMLGKYNPQSSKLMREAILPTWSTLDLTNQKDNDLFMLGVAQAWGVKVHKISRADSLAQVKRLEAGKFAPVVKLMQDWLESGFSFDADDVTVIKKAYGSDLSTMALHAGLELARARTTDVAGQKAFKTGIYVEADGVTDGPINAMVHFASGPFSPEWISNVAKGGLFFTSESKTMNDQFISDPSDLYESTKNHLVGLLGDVQKQFSSDPKLSAQMGAMLRTMDVLLPDVALNESGDLVIGRGVIKNPLTVTIYGSGANGIAAKITGAILDSFYQQQTQLLSSELPMAETLFGGRPDAEARYKQYLQDLTTLTESVVEYRRGAYSVNNMADVTDTRTGTGVDYALTAGQVKNLQQNILNMFVGPMQGAINNSIGDTVAATTAIQKATDVQSIFLKFAFQREVERMLAKKAQDPDWKKSDFLSQQELNKIYETLKHLSPLIETGTQSMFIAGSERSDIKATEFSRSLTDDLSSPAYVYGPTQAGVSGIPFTTISTGDGQMMQNFSAQGKSKGYLMIFDGANFSLPTLEEDSVRMNQAVHEGWQANPFGSVYDAYASFLQDVSFDNMSEEQRHALLISLNGFGTGNKLIQELDAEQQVAEIMQGMNVLDKNMLSLNQDLQARKAVLAKLDMSVDHMASAESPYQAKGGISLDGLDEAQQVQLLNQLRQEELNNIQKKKTPEQSFAKAFESLGTEDKSGVRVISSEDFRNLVGTLEVPQEHRAMLLGTLKSLRDKGWRLVFGSANDTAKFQAENGLQVFDHLQRGYQTVYGYTAMGDRTLYIHKATPETVVHELIHAATMEKVMAAYADPESIPQAERDSVKRMEGLMQEWLSMGDDLSELNAEIRQAYADSVFTIQNSLTDPSKTESVRKAAALNEFMAWSLSNQRIMKIQRKVKVKDGLLRIVGDALKALKNLIWGTAKAPTVGDDMLSNIRFNTAILLESPQPVQYAASQAVMYHSAAYGNSERLTALEQAFLKKVASVVNDEPVAWKKAVLETQVDVGTAKGVSMAHTFASVIPMTMQEKNVFTAVGSAFMAMADLDGNSMNSVSELHAHVVKQLEVEHFMADPVAQDPNDRAQAIRKFDLVTGKSGTISDERGRSSLMPAFLAISLVNDQFREILANMDVPKRSKFVKGTLDQSLDSLGAMAMEQIGDIMGGVNRNAPNVKAQIDSLTNTIADITDDKNSFRTQFDLVQNLGLQAAGVVDTANDWVVKHMQAGLDVAIDKLSDAETKLTGNRAKGLVTAVKLMTSTLSIARNEEVSQSVISTANRMRVWKPVSELLSELVGRTSDNGSIYDMIKAVRSMVQQTRQKYREEVPKIIASKFSREVTEAEWGSMHEGLAKTDAASLRSAFSTQEILNMVRDPALLAGHIARLASRLAANEPTRWTTLERKSDELAEYMVTGKVSGNLLRNATAVAMLAGENGSVSEADASLISDIDQYVSLKALEKVSKVHMSALSSLVQSEADGMSFVVNYLEGQRKGEIDKLVTDKAVMNAFKGYVPTGFSAGSSLIVADDTDGYQLLQRGWKTVAKYEGSPAEFGAPSKSYYFSPVSGRAPFSQGIMQNVHTTANGIDPVTGLSYGSLTAGKITDQATVQRIYKLRSRNEKATEPLMPVYDGQGKIVAYERSVLASEVTRLGHDTNLSKTLGMWRGRQIEEGLAEHYNDELIGKLYAMWDSEKFARGDEYVDILSKDAQKEDPVLKDAAALFTPHVKEMIKDTFGTKFMVRRDLINDVVGYRTASLGDAWTGVSRFSDEHNRMIQRAVAGVFGVDAYQRMVQAEKFTQQVMSDARTLIVVKSVVVPMSNILSNIYQLAARGVPLLTTLKQLPKKTAEVDRYLQNRLREIQIEAELRSSEKDIVKQRKLNVELKALSDANQRMSIWPLIEAGEFTSVSDGQLTTDDLALSQGRLLDYVEGLVKKVPKQLQTAAKYAWISKDTALFRGMTRAMQYGDFLAKSIQYDDLVKRKGKDSVEALRVISDEFVNYDRLPGRSRSYLESLGLLWFWNYKLRITKVAVSMIRENPLHSLIRALAPAPEIFGRVGDPISDNFFSVLEDGKLGHSVGPGMALHSLNLNPWLNVTR